MAKSNQCFSCPKKDVEYIQIEEISSSYAICQDCFKKLKENKTKYLKIKDFIIKQEEKIKKEFPNLTKLLQFKQQMEGALQWEKFINPHFEDALQFIRQENFTQKGFQILTTYFQKKGKDQEKLAIQIINYLNSQKFDIQNPIWLKETKQNKMFTKKYYEYLQDIIQKQLFQEIIKEIEQEIENTFSKIPEQQKQIGICLKNDDFDQQELNKYYGYINFIDLKDGKGILKNKDILYFGIFSHDEFEYGVKFEQISSKEGQFFFGSFFKEQIEGQGKMIAYKYENQIMYQKYEGEYENGLRKGKGKFIWQYQNKILTYDGSWDQNLQHGDGCISDQNGNKKTVQYEQGKLKQDNNIINQSQFPQNGFQQIGFPNQFQQPQTLLFQTPNSQFQQKFPLPQNEKPNAPILIDQKQTFDNLKLNNTIQSNSNQSSQQQTINQTQQSRQFPNNTTFKTLQRVQSTFQPLQQTQLPIQSTFQPLQQTQQPVQSTFQPLQQTQQPIQSPLSPLQQTQQPIQSTFQPLQQTQQPIQSTFQPLQQTQQPIQSKFQPLQQTQQSIQSPFQPLQQTQQSIQQPQQSMILQSQKLCQQTNPSSQQQFQNNNNNGKFKTDTRFTISQPAQQQMQNPPQIQKLTTLPIGNKSQEQQFSQNPEIQQNQSNISFQPKKSAATNVRQTIGSISNSQTLNY
ncbi:unnamed protein product [Paramecium pentaurelia]|uniref:MORN repeat protein n=1 Tax=Paramecium pentaurelia TaxID=43138 RepID=A0A8S1YEY7_9CILI|nr:unnamed protein product [Paramecium pentaurelia]